MMALDLRSLQKVQRDTGFSADFLEKAYHLTQILAGIFGNEELGKSLALKGGTALNFVYLNVPRVSIDLDFNFVGALEKRAMLQARPMIAEGIAQVAASMGYRISEKPASYIMDRLLLRYARLSGLPDSIKVEINYLERTPFLRIERKRFRDIFEGNPFLVDTYAAEEIAAMKTKAMVERLYARDIYDIYHMARLKLDRMMLRKLMILYMLMAGKRPEMDALILRVQKYDEQDIITAIKPFLREREVKRLNPAKIKKTVGEFYSEVFVLDENDRRFLESLDSGKIDLRILFGEMDFIHQANNHPALLRALERKSKRPERLSNRRENG